MVESYEFLGKHILIRRGDTCACTNLTGEHTPYYELQRLWYSFLPPEWIPEWWERRPKDK
jgi:hypothetical protein